MHEWCSSRPNDACLAESGSGHNPRVKNYHNAWLTACYRGVSHDLLQLGCNKSFVVAQGDRDVAQNERQRDRQTDRQTDWRAYGCAFSYIVRQTDTNKGGKMHTKRKLETGKTY